MSLWLNAHAQIRLHDELFMHHNDAQDSFQAFLLSTWFGRSLIPPFQGYRRITGRKARYYCQRFLRRLLSDTPVAMPGLALGESTKLKSGEKCPKTWAGMKLMVDQLARLPDLGPILMQHDPHIILLRRKCLSDVYISREVAMRRNLYHATEAPPPIRMKVDPQEAINYLNQINRDFELAQKLLPNAKTLELTYETFFSPETQEAEKLRIMQFLNLDINDCGPSPALTKIINQHPQSILENYAEYKSALEASGHEVP